MLRKTIVFCAVCALLIFGVFTMQSRERTADPTLPQAEVEQMQLPVPDTATQASSASEADKETLDGGGYYVLKAYTNRLAVYRVYPDGTQVLADLIDIDIRVLPKHDVESLQEGIVLRSNEALIRILEDFMS